MINYLRQIVKEFWSVLVGLRITMKYFFSKASTLQYPDERDPRPERFRGMVKSTPETCISCLYCVGICPVCCITLEGTRAEVPTRVMNKEGKEVKRLKDVTRFDIDISRCIQCGFCAEGCPTGAIYLSKDYENSALRREEMVYHYVKR